jgi:hypothetical protein
MPSSEKLSLSFFAEDAYNRKYYSLSSPLFNRFFAAIRFWESKLQQLNQNNNGNNDNGNDNNNFSFRLSP